MNSSMTTIQVSVETAEVLKLIQAEADARQLPLDVYLRTLAERANGTPEQETEPTPEERPFYETASSEEWIEALREWTYRKRAVTPAVPDESEAIDAAELSPQEKAERWREWVERNAVRVPTLVDDSRVSIYAEREDKQLPLSAAEKVAFFRQWIAGLDRNTPLLSDEAISRESMYSHEGER